MSEPKVDVVKLDAPRAVEILSRSFADAEKNARFLAPRADRDGLREFVAESNRIEGIDSVRTAEVEATEAFLQLPRITLRDLHALVNVYTGDAPLREREGMDVRVGRYVPPRGGVAIRNHLNALLDEVNAGRLSAYEAHVRYETLHPFMDGNGRSGRALWLWLMRGSAPLGFLHTFYYQALNASQR